jgi:hypothetical protein
MRSRSLKGVVVGDHDLCTLDLVKEVVGDELAIRIVAVGVVRLEHTQAVLDGEPRCDDEKAPGEMLAAGAAGGIDGLPRDEHRHYGGLARTGGELQRETLEFRVGVPVGGGEVPGRWSMTR